jgi:ABC-2 type transport system ATP-binding protein
MNANPAPTAVDAGPSTDPGPPVAEVDQARRRYGDVVALDGVSLNVRAGEVHALLGPNGAGKTTLLRLLTGLVDPTEGRVRVLGEDVARHGRRMHGLIGLVPSGDRSFYLRLSGLENLVFFARLHGLRRRRAVVRAREVIADVELDAAADRPVGHYSHGMQKRLSLARALLTQPALLLVDEATHDLDPEAARQARMLVRAAAQRGAGVLYATQRVEEVRGFADRVTVLARGHVRFNGSVGDLLAHSTPHRYLVRLRGAADEALTSEEIAAALGEGARVYTPDGEGAQYFTLVLEEHVVLGQALAALTAGGIDVLACREEQLEIEDAFLTLTEEPR